MFILCMLLLEKDGGCLSKHMKDIIKDSMPLLSVFTLKNGWLELYLFYHTIVVFS